MNIVKQSDGKQILFAMAEAIQKNKDYLGEVDGLIGDGDHGANMNKGFSEFLNRFVHNPFSFTDGLRELAIILMNEIGGSMGPIYGTIFMEMSDAIEGKSDLGVNEFYDMFVAARTGLTNLVDARVGDKTLVDTLSPVTDVLLKCKDQQISLKETMDAVIQAAEKGRDSTKNMVAKYGRSSRLGERSRGVLDAGATSCCILICAMADAVKQIIE